MTVSSRRSTVARVGAAALAVAVAGASAAEASDLFGRNEDTYRNAPVLSDAVLRELRGGMTVMGVEFSFGAIQTVLVDGTPVARTIFMMAQDGSLNGTLEILDGSVAAAFDGAPVPGMNLGSLAGLKGVIVPGENGASVALSGISPGAFHYPPDGQDAPVRHRPGTGRSEPDTGPCRAHQVAPPLMRRNDARLPTAPSLVGRSRAGPAASRAAASPCEVRQLANAG